MVHTQNDNPKIGGQFDNSNKLFSRLEKMLRLVIIVSLAYVARSADWNYGHADGILD